jgi:hypothetical protein
MIYPASAARLRSASRTCSKQAGCDGRIMRDTTQPNGQPRRKFDVSQTPGRFGSVSKTLFENGYSEPLSGA